MLVALKAEADWLSKQSLNVEAQLRVSTSL
jgi:hypothetical protein